MTPFDDSETARRLQAERAWLAPYALCTADSAGRRFPEAPHPYRTAFQRDRDRIVHSSAFRRLSDKTQVFTGDLGDYHRTRLTHTLEVAGIARTLARALRLNEDLVEALALAHDLGHPPFGHAGEDTLDACLKDEGGFNHNRQGLRILEELEHRSPDHPGLNLSFEVLEGQTARIDKTADGPSPPLEVQIVDAADGVAYDTHDADDALKIGLLTLDELLRLPLWRAAAERLGGRTGSLTSKELQRAVLHELVEWQVSDLLEQTSARLSLGDVRSVADVRATAPIVRANPNLAELKRELEEFLHRRVYRHSQVKAKRADAQAMLAEMFSRLVERPEIMPAGFVSRVPQAGLRRTVGDYLAGMTDGYARSQWSLMQGQRAKEA